jgi:hypothetical protein
VLVALHDKDLHAFYGALIADYTLNEYRRSFAQVLSLVSSQSISLTLAIVLLVCSTWTAMCARAFS